MQYINHKTNTVYSGDKANWRDAPVEIDKPGDYYTPTTTQNPDGTYSHTEWELTEKAKQRQLDDIREKRQAAYRDRSDPIFMKWQRGEATEQEWIDEVEAIRAEFPYPEETTG